MNMIALKIPELRQERASWLEDRIVAQDFSEFVTQLDVMVTLDNRDDRRITPRLSLEEILGTDRDEFLNNGLAGISNDQFFSLLASPEALAELNEQVFMYGGKYWGQKIDDALSHARKMDGNSASSTPKQSAIPGVDRIEAVTTKAKSVRSNDRFKSNQVSRLFFVAASIAILICGGWLVRNAFFDDSNNQQVAQAWGWERDDWFEEAKTPKQYMARMIEGANAWGKKPVDSKDAYVTRLKQLMKGCQKMIDAEHPLLTETQKEQLVLKCIAWKEEFIDQFTEVTENPSEFRKTKKKTDATVEKAAIALGKILDV